MRIAIAAFGITLTSLAHADELLWSKFETPASRAVVADKKEAPSGSHVEKRPNMDMFWIGLAGFGAFYAGSVLYAMGTCGAQNGCRLGVAALGLFAFPRKVVVPNVGSLSVHPMGAGVGVTLTN